MSQICVTHGGGGVKLYLAVFVPMYFLYSFAYIRCIFCACSCLCFCICLLFSQTSPFDFTGVFAHCIDKFCPTINLKL